MGSKTSSSVKVKVTASLDAGLLLRLWMITLRNLKPAPVADLSRTYCAIGIIE